MTANKAITKSMPGCRGHPRSNHDDKNRNIAAVTKNPMIGIRNIARNQSAKDVKKIVHWKSKKRRVAVSVRLNVFRRRMAPAPPSIQDTSLENPPLSVGN